MNPSSVDFILRGSAAGQVVHLSVSFYMSGHDLTAVSYHRSLHNHGDYAIHLPPRAQHTLTREKIEGSVWVEEYDGRDQDIFV